MEQHHKSSVRNDQHLSETVSEIILCAHELEMDHSNCHKNTKGLVHPNYKQRTQKSSICLFVELSCLY